MSKASSGRLIGIVLVFLGLFGVAVAVTGMTSPLPAPAVGGTCGPGQGSEAAIVAFMDPVTIGAGPEPPVSQARNRTQWSAFVAACQSAADQRAEITLPTLMASTALLVVGTVVLWRRSRRPTGSGPGGATHQQPPQAAMLPITSPFPPPPGVMGSG